MHSRFCNLQAGYEFFFTRLQRVCILCTCSGGFFGPISSPCVSRQQYRRSKIFLSRRFPGGMNSTDPSALLSSASEEAAEAAILEQFAAARTAANASQLVQFSLGGVVSAADSSTDSLVSASAPHAGANTSISRVEESLGGPVVSGAGPSRFSGPSSQLMPQGAADDFSTEFSSVSSSVSITRFQSYIAYLRQPSGAGGVVRVQVVDQAEDVVLVLYDDSAHMEWISPTALLVPPPRQPNRAAPVPRALSRPTTPRGTPSKLGVSNKAARPLTPIQARMGVAAAASPRPSVTLVPSVYFSVHEFGRDGRLRGG